MSLRTDVNNDYNDRLESIEWRLDRLESKVYTKPVAKLLLKKFHCQNCNTEIIASIEMEDFECPCCGEKGNYTVSDGDIRLCSKCNFPIPRSATSCSCCGAIQEVTE